MLKAVVKQVQLRPEFSLRENASRMPPFSDNHRDIQPPRYQQRFVAKITWGSRGINQGHSFCLAPVTAREDIELDPSSLQQLAHQQNEGSLARATDREVSDADDWTPQSISTSDTAIVERISRPNAQPEE